MYAQAHPKNNLITVLVLENNLTELEVQSLQQTVNSILADKENVKGVMVDMEKVVYINSSGIGLLIHIFKIMQARKHRLALYKLNSKVTDILKLTKLYEVFRSFADEESAVEYVIQGIGS